LFASINEACKILEEGKAYCASDIDVMWLNGFGFPRCRGGLMCWPTASALCRLAETGTPFREAKPGRAMSAAVEGSAADRSRCPAVSPRQAGSVGMSKGLMRS
jgi:3-hydroxyacyl-CoA dehydrogenase